MVERDLKREEGTLILALIFGVVNAMLDTAKELCSAEENRCALFLPTVQEQRQSMMSKDTVKKEVNDGRKQVDQEKTKQS